jgi:hypothetical protein
VDASCHQRTDVRVSQDGVPNEDPLRRRTAAARGALHLVAPHQHDERKLRVLSRSRGSSCRCGVCDVCSSGERLRLRLFLIPLLLVPFAVIPGRGSARTRVRCGTGGSDNTLRQARRGGEPALLALVALRRAVPAAQEHMLTPADIAVPLLRGLSEAAAVVNDFKE